MAVRLLVLSHSSIEYPRNEDFFCDRRGDELLQIGAVGASTDANTDAGDTQKHDYMLWY